MFTLVIPECNGLDNLVMVVKFLLRIVQWVVPIILIVLGTIDLVRAVIAGKDEDIKKHQQTLIKRVIAAVIVFLIPLIVSILMGWIGNADWRTCWNGYTGTTAETISNIFKTDQLQ